MSPFVAGLVLALTVPALLRAAPAADARAPETQIRAAIESIRAAILDRSAEGIIHPGTPDWSFVGPDGVTLDRAGFVTRTQALFSRVIAIESLETTVDRIAWSTPEAADVEITQTMVRTERAADGAHAPRLRLHYRERQRWVLHEGSWWVQRVAFLGAPERTPLDRESALAPAIRESLLAGLRERRVALDRAVVQAPDDVALRSRRGDVRLQLGDFAGAVADFERMIALDETQDVPHWRLGIAYYFAGQFEDSARQFAKYHRHDAVDRENGLWKFLGEARVVGVDRARAALLPYTRFDREPFPALYELYAGRRSLDDFCADLIARGLHRDPRVRFFADYYCGLFAELGGHREVAVAFLREAVANRWGQTSEHGPAYMWQVARLHYESLTRDP